jgi:hypothetical protein
MQGLHRDRIDSIEATVTKFSAGMIPLMGVAGAAEGRAFAEQLVSSMRRVDYVRGLAARDVDARRNDASHPLFDPLMAAALAVTWGCERGMVVDIPRHAFWKAYRRRVAANARLLRCVRDASLVDMGGSFAPPS